MISAREAPGGTYWQRFFEIGEVGLDAVEVGAVRQQEENMVAVLMGDDLKIFAFCGKPLVVDDSGVRPQCLAQHETCSDID